MMSCVVVSGVQDVPSTSSPGVESRWQLGSQISTVMAEFDRLETII